MTYLSGFLFSDFLTKVAETVYQASSVKSSTGSSSGIKKGFGVGAISSYSKATPNLNSQRMFKVNASNFEAPSDTSTIDVARGASRSMATLKDGRIEKRKLLKKI